MSTAFRSLPDYEIRDDAWDSPIQLGPSDGTLRHGAFDNGIKYYVRYCKKPVQRASLALAVRVGSAVEEENERGVAHVVEHLAFNATENYTNHELVQFLESIGAEFGACQNAYTSCDETVYEMMVPTDDMGRLDDAFSVLSEFATKIRCAPQDLEKERGAVLEEWRMGNNMSGRLAQAHWKCVLMGSRYAERLPIGLEGVIRGVPAETVRAFYERWYRPENMAVVAVGDFPDLGSVVERLRAKLEGCRSRSAEPAPELPAFPFEPHAAPRCKAYEDREVVQPQVHISFKQPRASTSTPAEYREYIKDQLFHAMLNNRFFKISRRESPPFYAAQSSTEPLCATVQTACVSANVPAGGVVGGVRSLLLELARVRLYGFSDREIKIARQHLMAEAEASYLERDQSYSQDVRDEYVRHFLNRELVVGQEEEARLTKTLLPKVGLEELRPLAERMSPHTSCVVKTVEHRCGTSEAELLAVVNEIDALEKSGSILEWQQDDVPENIMDPAEASPGAVVSRRDYPALGATEVTLSNGMRCCIKHTKLLDDQVLMTGFAPGGLTEVPQADFRSASLSPVIAGELGIFGMKPDVAADILAGKRVELKPSESSFWRSFSGDQSPEDIETALQLMYKLFTSRVKPVKSELAAVMRMTRENVVAQIRDPMYAFSNRVRFINYGRCYLFAPFTMREFRKVDPEAACSHFNHSYCNPAEFTLCLTGNIEPDALMPLLEKYAASIPAPEAPRKRSVMDITPFPYRFPPRPVVEEVTVPMVSPIAQVQITLPVEMPRSRAREEAVWVLLCCRLLETRLMQLMRFKFGEVYTVSVSPFFGAVAPSADGIISGDIAVGFSCSPSNGKGLVQAALREICALQEEGPTEKDVSTVLTLERREHETQQEENSYWQELMVAGYQSRSFQDHGDLDLTYTQREEAREKVIGSATSETVKEALKRLMPFPATKRYTAITMVPRLPWALRLLLPLSSFAGSVNSRLRSRTGFMILAGASAITAIGVAVLRCTARRR